MNLKVEESEMRNHARWVRMNKKSRKKLGQTCEEGHSLSTRKFILYNEEGIMRRKEDM